MYILHFKTTPIPLSFEQVVVWILRTIIFSSGIYHLLWGIPMLGVLILVVLAGILFPGYFTKATIKKFPLEVEIVLLTVALITSVLGEGQNFYGTIPYYDKFVHAIIPFFMGLFGLLIFYSLRSIGHLQMPPWIIVTIVILIMLGVQSVWEIAEYVSDKTQFSAVLAWEQAQGNAMEDPYHDTMNDLVVDAVGTIVGTALAFSWIKNGEHRAHYKVRTLIEKLKLQLEKSYEESSSTVTKDQGVYTIDSHTSVHEKTVYKQKPANKTSHDRPPARAVNI